MELALAEEIRALLDKRDESRDCDCHRGIENLWDAFPALAAKMLAVIDERNGLQMAIEEMGEVQDAVATRLNARRTEEFITSAARIAELKEDAVRWETRYRFAMEQFTEERNYHIHTLKEMQAAQKECDRLRFEASLLKEQPGC